LLEINNSNKTSTRQPEINCHGEKVEEKCWMQIC